MCGRYSFVPKKSNIKIPVLNVVVPDNLTFQYNIAPTNMCYVITDQSPESISHFSWGLVPTWSKDGVNQGKLINARAEGVSEKPSFRDSIKSRHCLVLADSFYEWRTGPGKSKIPYRIFLPNDELLLLAGIWDEWRDGERLLQTFSIITTAPNREMATIHNRMPLFFTDPAQQKKWLSEMTLSETLEMLQPPADGLLEMYRVSEKLNNVGFENPIAHERLPDIPTLF